MADHDIDWTKIQSAHDFEDLITTVIFLSDILSVDQVKGLSRNDLYWTPWRSKDTSDLVYRVIFDRPSQEPDQRNASLQRKFDEKVATVWHQGKADTKVYLLINFDDPPPQWSKNHKYLEIIKATKIAKTIEEGGWWPILHKYFEGGMHVDDAEKCEFLKTFTESLAPAVEILSIKETINVISWVESIAFYRPREVLAFCQTIFKSEKSDQSDKHPVFGSVTLGRKDYLEDLPNLLQPIAAHLDYFEGALELLLRISSDIGSVPHPIRGFLSQSVERITGYYYGRDFLVRDNTAYYNADFNQKTLDVVERMLREEGNGALLAQCLAVIPKLLETKVDTSEWADDKGAVTWRKYRLPVSDEHLKGVRKRAFALLFTTFNETKDNELRHRCLVELQNAVHRLSMAEELQDEFQELMGFLRAHADDEDPFVLNWIVEILDSFSERGPNAIRADAMALQTKLQESFDLQLYHLLFGKMGWDPPSDELLKLVRQAFDQWRDDPKGLLLLVDKWHKSADSHPTGLRTFLHILGHDKTEYATNLLKVISNEPALLADLSPLFVQSLGHILCGIRIKEEAQWKTCVDFLLEVPDGAEPPDDSIVTIVLTGFHLHDYAHFRAADLELVEKLLSGASPEIRVLGSETLWHFHKYTDLTAVLRVYEALSEGMNQELAASILKGISHDSHQERFAEKWADDDRRRILKKIVFSIAGFPRLDWDSMVDYYLERLLRIIWQHSTDDLLEFFQLRLDPERTKREGYDPLRYELSTLFQGAGDEKQGEKQNEFVSRVLEWDVERYGIYWIARLIGLACNTNVQPATVETLGQIISKPKKHQLLMIAKLLDQIPLGETFYDLAMRIVKRGFGRKEIRSQLYSSFISTTGGSRTPGQPFPSSLQHKALIDKYRSLNKRSKKAQKFLDLWEAEIDTMMRRDEQEDLER